MIDTIAEADGGSEDSDYPLVIKESSSGNGSSVGMGGIFKGKGMLQIEKSSEETTTAAVTDATNTMTSHNSINTTYAQIKTTYTSGSSTAGEDHSNNNSNDAILQIYRQKQRILMEANLEKDQRLERLEKEYNDHNIQHKEGIYWLRLQLDTTRKEKDAADERIAALQKELHKMTASSSSDDEEDDLSNPSRSSKRKKESLHSNIGSNFSSDERDKDALINQLQHRIETYKATFVAMEQQMAMMKSSSGDVIKTLKEEIADLMEDRTRAELDLMNQLSELDNENRRRQLEYSLDLHNKNETIERLRHMDLASGSSRNHRNNSSASGNVGMMVIPHNTTNTSSSLGTILYNGSNSTAESTSGILGECDALSDELDEPLDDDKEEDEGEDAPPTEEIRVVHENNNENKNNNTSYEFLWHYRREAEEEKAELKLMLETANNELEVLRRSNQNATNTNNNSRTGLSNNSVRDNISLVQRVWEEGQAIDLSIDRVSALLESTEATVSRLKDLVEKSSPNNSSNDDDDAQGSKNPKMAEKERMLSVLESASLIHDQVKVSITLIELKVRNQFECLKNDLLANQAGSSSGVAAAASGNTSEETMEEMKEIQACALNELQKAREDFYGQLQELEDSTILEKSRFKDLLREPMERKASKHGADMARIAQTTTTNNNSETTSKTDSGGALSSQQGSSRAVADCGTGKTSDYNADNDAEEDDGLMISRQALQLLEKELVQFAERMQSKNATIESLKSEVQRHKVKESNLRKELRASIKVNLGMNHGGGGGMKSGSKDSKKSRSANAREGKSSKGGSSSSSSNHNKHGTCYKTKETYGKGSSTRVPVECRLPPNIPTEVHTTRRLVKRISSIHVDPETLNNPHMVRDLSSSERDPTAHQVPEQANLPNRHGSIHFQSVSTSNNKDTMHSESTTTGHKSNSNSSSRRLKPSSREIKRLVFLPPCFFSDYEAP